MGSWLCLSPRPPGGTWLRSTLQDRRRKAATPASLARTLLPARPGRGLHSGSLSTRAGAAPATPRSRQCNVRCRARVSKVQVQPPHPCSQPYASCNSGHGARWRPAGQLPPGRNQLLHPGAGHPPSLELLHYRYPGETRGRLTAPWHNHPPFLQPPGPRLSRDFPHHAAFDSSYFQERLAGVNSTTGTLSTNYTGPTDTFNFNNWVTLLSQLPLLLFTLLNSFLYQCIPESVRILGSLLGILLLFALTAALVKVDMSPGPFFSITMASVWFINSFCAVLQGSLFGQLGTMPSTYSTLFLSGQGLAGIFAALAKLLSVATEVSATGGADSQTAALGYFITPCVGILMSIVCYLSLPHLEFARYYLAKKPSQSPAHELETKTELLQDDEKNGIPNSPQKIVLTLNLDAEKEPEPELDEPQKPEKPSIFVVFWKIWLTALCLVLVFTVTLSVFPAITAMVTSFTSPGKWSQFFNPICCFLLFNVMDWLGRSLTSYFLWPDEDSRLLPLLVCLRFLFIPLFMLCHVPERSRLPILFPQDAYFITFMLLFAISNGYLVSLTMCLAPRQVLPHEREVAGALMTFFLALGLSCGASLSFLFKALL
uniref:Equilibrative nucleoside transporter 2 n=1 Tax=Castor canadensis TaxID=51338 RepID=A0A8B7ULF4_CASCN|nr:equilibrative nucleoside transporter 2 isoform X2 [Castor canadensis]